MEEVSIRKRHRHRHDGTASDNDEVAGLGLEVCGRHALFFDDDAGATFVNSTDALVPLNGHENLLIDRYDVRHLVSEDQLRRRTSAILSRSPEDDDIDYERFRDLRNDDDTNDDREDDEQGQEILKRQRSDKYQTVPFSYGNEEKPTQSRSPDQTEESTGFDLPFPVPETLLSNIPPTEKAHQIIARTAKFVSEHGGQSEIVLRVKQGSNPVFGFLMPDHNLYSYYRYLVDHPEIFDTFKAIENGQIGKDVVSGEGLSLLGSVYGTGDDEDECEGEQSPDGNDKDSSLQRVSTDVPLNMNDVESNVKEHDQQISNISSENVAIEEKFLDTAKTKAASSEEVVEKDLQAVKSSDIQSHKQTDPIVEPPLSLQPVVEKMVEFIVRNGKEFEAIIVNQDRTAGRFPFLLPTNKYHTYYLKALEEAQQRNLRPKSPELEKKSRVTHHREAQRASHHKSKSSGLPSRASSVPEDDNHGKEKALDLEKKKKLQLVFGSSKKDVRDIRNGKPKLSLEEAALAIQAATRRTPNIHVASRGNKEVKDEEKEGGVSVDDAAAIVMAATRGIRKPIQSTRSEATGINDGVREKMLKNLLQEKKGNGVFAGISNEDEDLITSSNGVALSHECGQASGKSISLEVSTSAMDLKSDLFNQSHDDTSLVNDMVKEAALAASREGDSHEASLSHGEKRKAERLKKAKMFAALLKSGQQTTVGLDEQKPSEVTSSIPGEPKAMACDNPQVTALPDSPKDRISDSSTRLDESLQADAISVPEDSNEHAITKSSSKNIHGLRSHHHHRSPNHKQSTSNDIGDNDDLGQQAKRYTCNSEVRAHYEHSYSKDKDDHGLSRRHHHERSTHYKRSSSNDTDDHDYRERRSREHKHDREGNHRRSRSREHKHDRDGNHRRSRSREDNDSRHQRSERHEYDSELGRKHSRSGEGKIQRVYNDGISRKSREDGHRRHKRRNRSRSRENDIEKRYKKLDSVQEEYHSYEKSRHKETKEDSKLKDDTKVLAEDKVTSSSVTNVSDELRAKVRAMLLANL